MFIHSLFERAVNTHGLFPAVSLGSRVLNYDSLNKLANQLSHKLLEEGVGPGSIVGVCLKRSPELVASLIAILKVGAAYLPLDPEYPQERLKYMINHSKIDCAILNEEFSKKFSQCNFQRIVYENLALDLYSNQNPVVDTSRINLAYIIYTSGSTGKPKGVSMGHAALVNLIKWQNEQTKFKSSSITLQYTPVSFDVHFQEIFSTLSLGGELVLIEEQMRLDPVSLLKRMNEKKVNRLFLPYVALNHLTEIAVQQKIIPSSLKEVTTAGEQLKITSSIREFFKILKDAALYNHYGPSETHVVTSFELSGDSSSWAGLPPIGKEISNSKVYLLDESLKEVVDGEVGELYLGGLCLANGYLHSPELTDERFLTLSPFGRVYKTGDLGQKDENGDITFLGRKDGQVKVRGYRIELGEIELAIQKENDVDQSVVKIIEDNGENVIVAYVSGRADLNEIRTTLRAELPEYMIPSFFMKLDKIPLTPSGKVDYKALPKPSKERPDLAQDYAPVESQTEHKIAELWSKYLGIADIGIDDSFFDLGGNSLLAIKVMVDINQTSEKKLSIVNLFQYSTIRKISQFLDQKEDESFTNFDVDDSIESKDIAVIGMTGRFPGARNIQELWENLLQKKNGIEKFDPKELNPFVEKELAQDPNYVFAHGAFQGQENFDYKYFGMTPREAELMDPQQRKFLELSVEALELAGYNPDSYKGSIGVYAGMGNSKYNKLVDQHAEKVKQAGDFNVMLGLEKDYIATRVAFKLNLRGPALSLHTGCSTSLVAIVEAVKSLRHRNCDMALAGGVSISGAPKSGHLSQEGGILSADGICRPFDESATGTIFTDGGGIVVLKRLDDAQKDGDTILAVIKGVGINNDGSDKMSFTAPSVRGQKEVILKAQRDARVDPRSISFIEAHGTATPVGDPIEVQALTEAFSTSTSDKNFCYLSSIKSNIGHLTAASGVASFIKTVSALNKGIIPGTANFKNENAFLKLEETPFIVTNENSEFPKGQVKRAGVSSFGVGGTNAHVVLEEYIAQEHPTLETQSTPSLFKLSAKSEAQLEKMTDDLKNLLKESCDSSWKKIAFTLENGRKEFNFRTYLVLGSKDQIQKAQGPVFSGKSQFKKPATLYFMFPGQGSQYFGMGKELYESNTIFKKYFDKCCEILDKELDYKIKEIIFSTDSSELNNTYYTQPAIFLIEYSLAATLMDLGINPKAFIGHSIGEFVAATLANVFSLEDGLRIIAKRAELMNSLPSGMMLSVASSPENIKEYVEKSMLDIAAVNGTSSCVVAGEESLVLNFQKKMEELGIGTIVLKTSHAFHSRMMKPAVEIFRSFLSSIKMQIPKVPIYSTVTTNLETELLTRPDYWANHIVDCVMFAPTVSKLLKDEKNVFLEVGTKNILTNLTKKQGLSEKLRPVRAFPVLSDSITSENHFFLKALGELWINGLKAKNINSLFQDGERKRVPATTYAFEENPLWLNHKEQPVINVTYHTSVRNYPMSNPKKDKLSKILVDIFEKSSGIEVGSYGLDTSFLEMGMDSLFLTQVSLVIKKDLKVSISFRQLIENYGSIDLLADYLLDKVTIEVEQEAPKAAVKNVEALLVQAPAAPQSVLPQSAAPVETMSYAPRPVAAVGGLEEIINRQLELMTQQMLLLNGHKVINPTAQPVMTTSTPSLASEVVAPKNAPVVSQPKEVKRGADVKKAKDAFGAAARITVEKSSKLDDNQLKMIHDFFDKYNAKNKASKNFTQDYRKLHADPRVVTGFKPEWKEIIYPIVVKKSSGQNLWDMDDNKYIDMTCGFGSNFFGNGNEKIKKLVMKQLEEGIELGPQHPLVGEVSQLINELTGNERTAFCNTGSEAVLGAMRIARTVTGREKIIVFSGSYHGIADEVILRGSKVGKSFPAAPGINDAAVSNMIVLDYGTEESLKIIRELANDVAAVLIEPVQSRRCDFHPKEFLQEVRKITTASETCLIFDEVITGFRIKPGGAQEYFGIRADVCTYGKIVGGGMPIGVISGKAEYMDALDGGHWQYGDDSTPTVGVTYFAGTFVRHPLALAAAKGALEIIKEGGVKQLDELSQRAQAFADELNLFLQLSGVPLEMNNFGSLMKPKWKSEVTGGELLFAHLRYNGVHVYDGFPWFVNLAHTEADLRFVLEAFKKSVASMQMMGLFPSNKQVSIDPQKILDLNTPPVKGAKIGRDQNGNPAWFVENPDKAGEYFLLEE